MKVAVICEFSGVVRRAFQARGHEAYSYDLLPAEDGERSYHIQGDCRERDYRGFSLAICHPPCTYLAVSGARWFKDRQAEQQQAIEFVKWCWELPIEHIAIENPIGVLSTKWRKPDQIIQPWQFGHPESKSTCLWLKNLPKLVPTNILPLPESGRWENQTPSGQNKLGPSPTRSQTRSRTYHGIAEAMAKQWSTAPCTCMYSLSWTYGEEMKTSVEANPSCPIHGSKHK